MSSTQDDIRDDIRTHAERAEQVTRRLSRIEIRTQARLDGYSAERGIRPPLDMASEDLPPDVDPLELAEFIGHANVADGQMLLAELEDLQDQLRYLACQAEPRPGDEVCYPIMYSDSPMHPQYLNDEEVDALRKKFEAFGIPTKIVRPSESAALTSDDLLTKLEATVEEELVDQYIVGWIAMSHLVELGKLDEADHGDFFRPEYEDDSTTDEDEE